MPFKVQTNHAGNLRITSISVGNLKSKTEVLTRRVGGVTDNPSNRMYECVRVFTVVKMLATFQSQRRREDVKGGVNDIGAVACNFLVRLSSFLCTSGTRGVPL